MVTASVFRIAAYAFNHVEIWLMDLIAINVFLVTMEIH